jgi:hypothetical protein
VVVREGRKAYKERVGRNRRDAEWALRKIAVSIDDGVYRPQENIGFSDWADRWLVSLERKPSTVGSYRSTINLAKEMFANKPVRRLGPEDITRFNESMRTRGASTSTRAKHLRVLGACLQAAFRHRYAAANPVRELHPALKPDRSEKKPPTSRTRNLRASSPSLTRARIGPCASPPSRPACGRANYLASAGAMSIFRMP